jgi:hypothetical protein
MKKVVHKQIDFIRFGMIAIACGGIVLEQSRASINWAKVTCERCLAHKKGGKRK